LYYIFFISIFLGHGLVLWDCGEQPVILHISLILNLNIFSPCPLFYVLRYGLFYDENEDPMDALKAASQPKEAPIKVTKAAETKVQAPVKPAEVKGKAGAAQQPAAGVKKAAQGPKEASAAGQNRTAVDGQNKPREGKRLINMVT